MNKSRPLCINLALSAPRSPAVYLRCIQVKHESSTISAFPPEIRAHRPPTESAKVRVSAAAIGRGIFLVDGIEAVRELRARGDELPVILISTKTHVIERCQRLGHVREIGRKLDIGVFLDSYRISLFFLC
jgi:hypothetical protein